MSPNWTLSCSLENSVRWHRLFRGDSLQGSHGRAFRTFVALCRTRDTHLLCKHLSPPFPASIQDDVLPSSSPFIIVVVWSQSLTSPPNGASSGTRDTCVPHRPDTCRAQCRRRARRTHDTLMVTVTDHVGARIFSPSRRSSRIHHRNSDTLGRGVNNDCIRGLKLILSKRALTIETNWACSLRNVWF